VLAAALVLAALVAVSGWLRMGDGNPRATINSVWQWVAFAVAFFLMRQWIVEPEERRAVCAVTIGLAVVLAVFGYYQYLILNPQTRILYEQDPVRAYLEAGLGADPDPQMKWLFYARVYSREPLATFALTNSLAGFLAPWLTLACGMGLLIAKDRFPRWRVALAGVAWSVLLVGGCFVLTKSRTAWGATLCGILMIGYVQWRGARCSIASNTGRPRRP
jgi:hypothetical protein